MSVLTVGQPVLEEVVHEVMHASVCMVLGLVHLQAQVLLVLVGQLTCRVVDGHLVCESGAAFALVRSLAVPSTVQESFQSGLVFG